MKIPQFLDTSRTLTTEIWKLAIKCLQIHVPMGLKKKVCLWYWLQNLGNQDNLGYITMMYIPVQVSSNYANLSKVSKNSDQLAHFLPRPSVCLAKSKPLCVAGAISNHIILLFISIFSVGVTLPLLQSPSSRQ